MYIIMHAIVKACFTPSCLWGERERQRESETETETERERAAANGQQKTVNKTGFPWVWLEFECAWANIPRETITSCTNNGNA